MIIMDIPMPGRCMDCPCSRWITSGEYEGLLMCNAMEFKTLTAAGESFHEDIRKYFIVEEDHQPSNCPIKSELILTKDETKPGEPVDYLDMMKKQKRQKNVAGKNKIQLSW